MQDGGLVCLVACTYCGTGGINFVFSDCQLTTPWSYVALSLGSSLAIEPRLCSRCLCSVADTECAVNARVDMDLTPDEETDDT